MRTDSAISKLTFSLLICRFPRATNGFAHFLASLFYAETSSTLELTQLSLAAPPKRDDLTFVYGLPTV